MKTISDPAAEVRPEKHAQQEQPVSCPLCFSPFTSHEIVTNHELEYYASGEVRGVLAGKPTLHAVCLKGCTIHVQASITTGFLFKKEVPRIAEENPQAPHACGYEADPAEPEQ